MGDNDIGKLLNKPLLISEVIWNLNKLSIAGFDNMEILMSCIKKLNALQDILEKEDLNGSNKLPSDS